MKEEQGGRIEVAREKRMNHGRMKKRNTKRIRRDIGGCKKEGNEGSMKKRNTERRNERGNEVAREKRRRVA